MKLIKAHSERLRSLHSSITYRNFSLVSDNVNHASNAKNSDVW